MLAHAVPGLSYDTPRMQATLDPSVYAAEAAMRLVRDEGIPFREAYQRVKDGR